MKVNNASSAEAAAKVREIAKPNKPLKFGESLKGAPEAKSASVTLSDRAKDMAKARSVVEATPDADADKVARIKAQLAAGTYDINYDAVADRMMKDDLAWIG